MFDENIVMDLQDIGQPWGFCWKCRSWLDLSDDKIEDPEHPYLGTQTNDYTGSYCKNSFQISRNCLNH